jgi:hypothetical protein
MSAPDAERPTERQLWWWAPPGELVPDYPPVDITDACRDSCIFADTPIGDCNGPCAYQAYGQRIEVPDAK